MKLFSDFALLDIQKGRKRLGRFLKRHPEGVEVTVKGVITSPWGLDDGVSQEFEIRVKSVEIKE